MWTSYWICRPQWKLFYQIHYIYSETIYVIIEGVIAEDADPESSLVSVEMKMWLSSTPTPDYLQEEWERFTQYEPSEC